MTVHERPPVSAAPAPVAPAATDQDRFAAETAPIGNAPSAVVIAGVSAGYGHRTALNDVTLTVRTGSLLAVIGPNGAGKSTLLKLIAGLTKPWSGHVTVLGREPGAEARRIA